MTSHTDILGALDAVLVINLDDRPDKWEAIHAHLKNFTPASKIHRISGVRGTLLAGYLAPPWFRRSSKGREHVCAGQAGCTLAHVRALRYAQERKFRRILVLEDDVRLNDNVEDALNLGLEKISDEKTPTLLYLGCHDIRLPILSLHKADEVHKPDQTESSFTYELFQIGGALGTYAMILNEATYAPLLSHLIKAEMNPWGWVARYKAIDQWLSDHFLLFGRVYGIFPSAVHTPPSSSDISGEVAHYDNQENFIPKGLSSEQAFLKRLARAQFSSRFIIPFDECRRRLRARLFGYRGDSKGSST